MWCYLPSTKNHTTSKSPQNRSTETFTSNSTYPNRRRKKTSYTPTALKVGHKAPGHNSWACAWLVSLAIHWSWLTVYNPSTSQPWAAHVVIEVYLAPVQLCESTGVGSIADSGCPGNASGGGGCGAYPPESRFCTKLSPFTALSFQRLPVKVNWFWWKSWRRRHCLGCERWALL